MDIKIPTSPIVVPSKNYPKWDFCFENVPTIWQHWLEYAALKLFPYVGTYIHAYVVRNTYVLSKVLNPDVTTCLYFQPWKSMYVHTYISRMPITNLQNVKLGFLSKCKNTFFYIPILIVLIFGLQKYWDIIVSKHSPLKSWLSKWFSVYESMHLLVLFNRINSHIFSYIKTYVSPFLILSYYIIHLSIRGPYESSILSVLDYRIVSTRLVVTNFEREQIRCCTYKFNSCLPNQLGSTYTRRRPFRRKRRKKVTIQNTYLCTHVGK
jgi:hypothetical protein